VIKDLNSKKLAGGQQLPCGIEVFRARVGRSSRVIVSNDNTVSVIQDSSLKDLSWMNEACRDGSMTYNVIAGHLISCVKMQSNEMFF
jgi:hypothetical protein